MAAVPKKLYANKPSTGSTTLYTVPANSTTIVKNIVLCNTSGSTATITLNASGQAVMSSLKVDPNDTVTMDLSLVLAAGDTISGLQGTPGAISVYISGVEVS